MTPLDAPDPVVPPPDAFNYSQHALAANAGRAAKPAFVDDLRVVTYAQLEERVRRLAAGLRALGVRRDERVLILMEDMPTGPWPSSVRSTLASLRCR